METVMELVESFPPYHLQTRNHAVPGHLASTPDFEHLPNEILLAIIARIPFNTTNLTNVSLVNRHIHELMSTSRDILVEDIAEIQYPVTNTLRPLRVENGIARLYLLSRNREWTVWIVNYSLSKVQQTCSASELSQLAWRISLGVHLMCALQSRRHNPNNEVESAFWLSSMPYELLCILRLTSIHLFAAFRQLVTDHHFDARRVELLDQPLAIQAFERSMMHLRLFSCFSALYPQDDDSARPEAAEALNTIDTIFEGEVVRNDCPFYLHQSLEARMPGIRAFDFVAYHAGWGAVVTDCLLVQYLKSKENISEVQKMQNHYQDYADALRVWIEDGSNYDGTNHLLAREPGMPLLADSLRTFDWCTIVEKMVRSEAGNLPKEAPVRVDFVPMAVEYIEWISKLRKDGTYDEVLRLVPNRGVLAHCRFLAVRKLMVKKACAHLQEQILGGC